MHGRFKPVCLDEAAIALERANSDGISICLDTASLLLQRCVHGVELPSAKRLHESLVHIGLDSIRHLEEHIVRLFCACGSLSEAERAFSKASDPSLYTWNLVISAHVKFGDTKLAFWQFSEMWQKGHEPDRITFLTLLRACGVELDVTANRLVHNQIVQCGVESDMQIGSAIVDMYARCGNLEEAYKLFRQLPGRDVVSWGVLITGCIQHGHSLWALELFQKMLLEGIKPDRVTFLSLVKACSHLGTATQGRWLHDAIVKHQIELELTIGNALVDMYARCGCLDESVKVLTGLHLRDAVSWNGVIGGYVQHGLEAHALDLFEKMQVKGTKPSKVSFLCVLKACINVGALARARLIHEQVVRYGLQHDLEVGNALIDMYSKLGIPIEAYTVFYKLPIRDIISWGAMIAGYAQVGNCKLVMKFLEDMTKLGLRPNETIFTSILAAYSCAGHLQEAWTIFKCMEEDYGIAPNTEHYSCIVDLLARAGCLKEAERLFKMTSLKLDAIPLKSLLTSCKTHGNTDLGQHCFEQAVEAEPADASNYVLMSSLYMNAQMREDVVKLRERRTSASAWKKPGKAWIEVNERVNEFIMGSKDHQRSGEFFSRFLQFHVMAKQCGHVPQLDAVPESI